MTADSKKVMEERLFPRIRGDGGWAEIDREEEDGVRLIFRGECSKCHMLDRCVAWMENEILQETGESVKILAERRRPFFWDQV